MEKGEITLLEEEVLPAIRECLVLRRGEHFPSPRSLN